MADYSYNGTNLELTIAKTGISNSVLTLSVAGATSDPFTAPNTSTGATGIWVFFHSVPVSPNNTVLELLESGVSKRSVTLNNADIQVGWNYAQFSSAYTFTTTTANAYTLKASNTYNSSGGLRYNTTKFAYAVSTNSTIAVSALGVGDDLFVAGIHNSGLTPQTLTFTGTSNSFGSGTFKAYNYQTSAVSGAAIHVGNGGTVKLDNTANCTVQVRGGVFVTNGGLFDMRGSATKSIVTKLIFDCETADGNYGLFNASNVYGGQILTTGATVPYSAQYSSGLGTTASPVVTSSAHGFAVGDEIIFGGATDYLKNELKFVKTIPNSTSLTLSDTSGGAESGLSQTHGVGSYIGNMTRNVVVSSLTNTRGYWVMNQTTNTTPISDFSYTRFEYPNISSSFGTQINNQGNEAGCDGSVWYNSSATGRGTLLITGNIPKTYTGMIMYNQRGTNYSAQSGIVLNSSANKTLVDCLNFNAPNSTLGTAFLSFNNTTNCMVVNSHSYGGNATNTGGGYAVGLFGSSTITFNNCRFEASRQQAIYLSSSQNIIFNNSEFGTMGNNTADVYSVSGTLNQVLFNNCNFGSTNLLTNYQNMLAGSSINFHKYQQTNNRHRWYQPNGTAISTYAGSPDDTTVRTAGSINLRIAPENNVDGFVWTFKVVSTVNQQTFLNGFMQKNATFGTSTAKVELWLPDTSLSSPPDASFTADNTTGTWNTFSVNKNYTGTVNALSTVKVTAISSTAGAYLYIADLYNSQDALNLWDNAQPVGPVIPTSFAGVAGLVWSYPDTNTTAGTMGDIQAKTKLTNVLAKDALS